MHADSVLILGSDPDTCHIVFQQRTVSGVHCRLDPVNQQVIDVGSTNGTFLDGFRLEVGVAYSFRPDSQLALGRGCVLTLSPKFLAQLAALDIRLAPFDDRLVSLTTPSGRSPDEIETGSRVVASQASERVPTAPTPEAAGQFQPSVGPATGGKVIQATRFDTSVGTPGAFVVGRNPENAFHIESSQVSWEHAEIRVGPDKTFLVRDLGSSNGTRINEQSALRLEPNNFYPVGIEDTLYLGSYRFPLRHAFSDSEAGRSEASATVTPEWQVIGRVEPADIVVDASNISRRHARVRLVSAGRYEIEDLGSQNGTWINSVRITTVTEFGVGDTVTLGSTPLQIISATGKISRASVAGLTLQTDTVRMRHYPDLITRTLAWVSKNPAKAMPFTSLKGVSFTVRPSELVGLMGPSGCGKTTLMRTLNGYQRPVEGMVRFNQVDLYTAYDAFRDAIGYVPQEDVLPAYLTVEKALRYSAQLRLPSDTTDDEIETRITRTLRSLGLTDCRHREIGDVEKKTISGGQRKRVSLAMELINEPDVLFLDEPTSGLSSEDTLIVMKILRELADAGKTIVLTIHQPSLEAYKMMHQVIYLVDGHLAYFGPSWPDSIDFFYPSSSNRLERDARRNDPGNALKPLTIDISDTNPDGSSRTRKDREVAVQRRSAVYEASAYFKEYVIGRKDELTSTRTSPKKTQRAPKRGFFRQLSILNRRLVDSRFSDWKALGLQLVQAPIVATMIVLMLIKLMDGDASAWFVRHQYLPSAFFLLVTAAVWFGASSSARELVGERPMYTRERMVGLRHGPYLLSKYLVLGALAVVQTLFMFVVTGIFLRFEGNLAAHAMVLALCTLVGTGVGLVLSALSSTVQQAFVWLPLALIPQVIAGGGIVPLQEVPTATRWITSVMPIRWGYESALLVEYGFPGSRHRNRTTGLDLPFSPVREVAAHCLLAEEELPGSTGQIDCQVNPLLSEGSGDPSGRSMNRVLYPLSPYGDTGSEEPTCQILCHSLRTNTPISPIERSFGTWCADTMRAADEGSAFAADADRGDGRDRCASTNRQAGASLSLANRLWRNVGVLVFMLLLSYVIVHLTLKRNDPHP